MREHSFMKSLFHGVIAEDLVFPYPSMTSEERETVSLICDSVRKFCEAEVDSVAIDREHAIPSSVLEGMKELGLFGLIIPEEHGGLGLSSTAYARVMEELATIDASLAVTVGAHSSIGLKGILLAGTDEQKARFLPKLATGESTAAFALTEPGAGSDAGAITTRITPAGDGEHYILSGSKIWITNGGFADVFTVFARLTDPDSGERPGITAIVVERGEGVESGAEEDKLGIRGTSTTEISFDEVRVPVANVLGEPGRGFKVAMQVLNSGRLGLAAGSVGNCKRLIGMAVERSQERVAFKKKIGEFGMIQDKISQMMCRTYALESMTYLTTGLIDAGVSDYSLESAICKVHGSETLWAVVNEALQIAGGLGYMTEYPYERILRDSRINLIFEGTNEILRAFIALSGLQGPGKQLAEVLSAIRDPIKGFGILSDFALQKAKNVLGPDRTTKVHPRLKREAVVLEECTAALARESERVIRKHGRELHLRQFAQKRIAEAAIDLYGLAAVLARTTAAIEEKGEEGAAREIDLSAGYLALIEARLRYKLDHMERDDDELFKQVARTAYADGGYPFDLC
jgi:acyl-CoA dehydrogenase family protein 9